MNNIKTLIHSQLGRLEIRTQKYLNTGNTAVLIENNQGERLFTLSVNTDVRLPANQFYAKTYSENEHIAKSLLKQKVFVDTGERLASGYVMLELWEFNSEIVR
jgi:hypothetical protein